MTTAKRILILLVIWSAIGVIHNFGIDLWVDRVRARGSVRWLDHVLAYGLLWPGDILWSLGFKGFWENTGYRVLHSAVWALTVGATATGLRWLWSMRP